MKCDNFEFEKHVFFFAFRPYFSLNKLLIDFLTSLAAKLSFSNKFGG